MTALLPFLISFLIGYALNLILLKKANIPLLLQIFLSVGPGLGLSSLITFYSFLLCNGFNPIVIFALNIVLLITLLLVYVLQEKKKFSFTFDKCHGVHRSVGIGGAFFLALLAVVYTFAKMQPFGQWDAWALWNMKAKFLTSSGSSWMDTFQKLHWHTQPDYPLLLPMMNIWGWALSPRDFYTAPLILSIVFTLSCGGLLFAGLMRYTRKDIAIIASGLLFFLPWYLLMGTAQYADIVLAYYLLASFVCIVYMLREKHNGFAVLLGLFLGVMTFTKNEGVLMAALLLLMTIFYLFLENPKERSSALRILRSIGWGLALTVPATLIFKCCLAPRNPDIDIRNMTITSQFFNYEGCYMILTALFQELTSQRWNYLWFFIMALTLRDGRRYFYQETKILTRFFLLYFLVLFFVYLGTVNFNLMWRLSRTLPRILFTLLPSVLFLIFYVFDYGQKNMKKEAPGA